VPDCSVATLSRKREQSLDFFTHLLLYCPAQRLACPVKPNSDRFRGQFKRFARFQRAQSFDFAQYENRPQLL
jgi:hypothetical protein